MPANELYHTWFDQIRQLCPQGRKTLIHSFTWLLIGIYYGGKVHLSLTANKIPGSAKLPSKVQRLRRLLQNRHIDVRTWYGPIAKTLLKSQAQQWPDLLDRGWQQGQLSPPLADRQHRLSPPRDADRLDVGQGQTWT